MEGGMGILSSFEMLCFINLIQMAIQAQPKQAPFPIMSPL